MIGEDWWSLVRLGEARRGWDTLLWERWLKWWDIFCSTIKLIFNLCCFVSIDCLQSSIVLIIYWRQWHEKYENLHSIYAFRLRHLKHLQRPPQWVNKVTFGLLGNIFLSTWKSLWETMYSKEIIQDDILQTVCVASYYSKAVALKLMLN